MQEDQIGVCWIIVEGERTKVPMATRDLLVAGGFVLFV